MSKLGVLIWRHIFESGDEKRIAQQNPDISDLDITKDIPYIDDQERGHLLDIYKRKDADQNNPVMINIHGGGLFPILCHKYDMYFKIVFASVSAIVAILHKFSSSYYMFTKSVL